MQTIHIVKTKSITIQQYGERINLKVELHALDRSRRERKK